MLGACTLLGIYIAIGKTPTIADTIAGLLGGLLVGAIFVGIIEAIAGPLRKPSLSVPQIDDFDQK
jgi:LytS/YehU family sensor histidine kinase